jgi:hypothetical protein
MLLKQNLFGCLIMPPDIDVCASPGTSTCRDLAHSLLLGCFGGWLWLTAASVRTQIQPGSAIVAAKTIPVLVARHYDSSPETSKAALESLGDLRPLAREAVAAQQKATKYDVKGVREAAAKSLQVVGGQEAMWQAP